MIVGPFYRDNAFPTHARILFCRSSTASWEMYSLAVQHSAKDRDSGCRPRLRHGASACKLIRFGGADEMDSVLSRLPMRRVPAISISANWTFCCSVPLR